MLIISRLVGIIDLYPNFDAFFILPASNPYLDLHPASSMASKNKVIMMPACDISNERFLNVEYKYHGFYIDFVTSNHLIWPLFDLKTQQNFWDTLYLTIIKIDISKYSF